ncbi:MAG TPA: zinc dependent phospholipase C family protein [Saprospiraceae bacterium]|nr:zinc dependent phospholipase C family protein [Saprospiraceae bacterium]
MKTTILYATAMATIILLASFSNPAIQWGFYAHKTINRMAVFILPPEMLVFFKKHIDYLSVHATDPDKRRYVVEGEALKHFMDIDHWGTYPFENVPHRWEDAYMKYLGIQIITQNNDTFQLQNSGNEMDSTVISTLGLEIDNREFLYFAKKELMSAFHEPHFRYPSDQLSWIKQSFIPVKEVLFDQHFTEHGILPYYINIQCDKLVQAFKSGDKKRILRLATDLGHYVADLHVPLHAAKNYNGQLTGQEGIHAFWESRLPEMFAEAQYNYFVGKAQYIPDIERFAWNTLIESNRLHHEVLTLERKIREQIPEDRQYAYEIRSNMVVRTPSEELSEAYHKALAGMVERRMQESVLALGSLWLTAWINAGQPVLDSDPEMHWTAEDIKEMELLEQGYQSGKELGRSCH